MTPQRLTFYQLPSVFPGQTIWGATGRRHNYVITQDAADRMRFSVSAKGGLGEYVMKGHSSYQSLDEAVSACLAIENSQ